MSAPRPLRIVSYNVRYFAHALKGLTSTVKSMQGIVDALCGLEPLADVICLQEVETDSLRASLTIKKAHATETQLERFMRLLTDGLTRRGIACPYEPFYFRAHTYRFTASANLYTTGLAMLVNRELIIDRHNAHAPHDITHRSLEIASGAKQTRICAHMRLGGARGLHVFNTHLSLPTPFSRQFWSGSDRMGYGPNQLVEVQTLARFIQRESNGERHVVVGDFNSLPGSPVYRYLTEDCGLIDLQARITRQEPDVLKQWPTAGFMNLRMHLDHVFASEGVKAIDLDETHAFGDRAGRFHGLSDHVPLVVRVA
jgi:endonuclease/exonuclease/phosphatase family metal-dependent hydrolase